MIAFRSFLLAVAAILPSAAHAEDASPLKGLWFVGGSISESQSAYIGAVSALPGGSLGHGLALRASVGGGHYEYDSGGTPIKADYAAAGAALVWQTSGNWGWLNVSAGPNYAHTDLSPEDPGNKLSGARWDLGLQTDGALDGKAWRLGWIGSYGAFDEACQARLSLARKLGNGKVRLGVEGGVMGDPSYTKGVAGGFVGVAMAHNLDIQLGIGASEQKGRGPRGYASIGVSKLF